MVGGGQIPLSYSVCLPRRLYFHRRDRHPECSEGTVCLPRYHSFKRIIVIPGSDVTRNRVLLKKVLFLRLTI